MTSNPYDAIIIGGSWTMDHGRQTIVYGPSSVVLRS
jgi:hypothetical protein